MTLCARVQHAWTQFTAKQRRFFRLRLKHTPQAQDRIRYQIIYALVQHQAPSQVAKILNCSLSLVYKVAHRFLQDGESGLVDRREDNGPEPVPWHFHYYLRQAVAKTPAAYGFHRPTWTLELLIQALAQKTGRTVSPSTMSRLLKENDIVRKRPKPYVKCPWPNARKAKRLKELQKLREKLPAKEVLLFGDEVDIHLNPKIGPDYMLRGQQKKVRTPGKNVKNYVAGGLEVRTGKLVWEEWENKSSDLFIVFLWKVAAAFPRAKKIHLIVDNYKIHKSKRTEFALEALKHRIVLHFLPPYSPDDNKIERLWEDLHNNVTRNHRCRTMKRLMGEVRWYLQQRAAQLEAEYREQEKERQKRKVA
jgi:transposase